MTGLVHWIGVFSLALASPAGAATWLDAGDREAIESTAQRSLDLGPSNEPTPWINPDTGSRGTFTPVSSHESAYGELCREYVITGMIGGREEQIFGMACRRPDGSWQEARATVTDPPPLVVPSPRNIAPPVRNPWGSWGVVPAISISGSYCDDGFCIGGSTIPAIWYDPFRFAVSWNYGQGYGHDRHYRHYRHRTYYREPSRHHGGHRYQRQHSRHYRQRHYDHHDRPRWH